MGLGSFPESELWGGADGATAGVGLCALLACLEVFAVGAMKGVQENVRGCLRLYCSYDDLDLG